MNVFATLDAEMAPIELRLGTPFTTFRQIVADQEEADYINERRPEPADGEEVTPPIAPGELWGNQVVHPSDALATWGPELRARFQIQTVAIAAAPAGQHLASYSLTVGADGTISAAPIYAADTPEPVPERISALQLNLALDEMGLLDDVEAAVAGGDRATQLYWAKTDPFERAHPKIEQLAAAIGKSPADVDALFRLGITKA